MITLGLPAGCGSPALDFAPSFVQDKIGVVMLHGKKPSITASMKRGSRWRPARATIAAISWV
jgi:hypothetical protein